MTPAKWEAKWALLLLCVLGPERCRCCMLPPLRQHGAAVHTVCMQSWHLLQPLPRAPLPRLLRRSGVAAAKAGLKAVPQLLLQTRRMLCQVTNGPP